MSNWTHAMCDDCWKREHPEGRVPIRVVGGRQADFDLCCFCGALTKSGIYVRRDPSTAPCRGLHDEAS